MYTDILHSVYDLERCYKEHGETESAQNLVGEGAVWDAERSGQSEVGQFDTSIDINEKVLWLEIAVDDTVTVTVRDAVQQLVQVTLQTYITR